MLTSVQRSLGAPGCHISTRNPCRHHLSMSSQLYTQITDVRSETSVGSFSSRKETSSTSLAPVDQKLEVEVLAAEKTTYCRDDCTPVHLHRRTGLGIRNNLLGMSSTSSEKGYEILVNCSSSPLTITDGKSFHHGTTVNGDHC